MRIPGCLSLVAVVMWLAPAALAEEPATEIAGRIAGLIEQLGDANYAKREKASRELVRIGPAARPALFEAWQSTPDAEIRSRCRVALGAVLEVEFQQRLQAFAADVAGTSDHGLPAWERYRVRLGDSRPARELFVEMQRHEGPLLATFAAGSPQLPQILDQQCRLLQAQIYGQNGVVRRAAPAGSVAAMLFLAVEAAPQAPQNMHSYLYNFCRQPSVREAIEREREGPLARLLGEWLRAQGGGVFWFQAVTLAGELQLPVARDLSLQALSQAQPHFRLRALMTLFSLGRPEDLPALEKLLTDEAVCSERLHPTAPQDPNRRIRVQVRDVALAAAIRISGQDLKDFQLDPRQAGPQGMDLNQAGFLDPAHREPALAKWREFSANRERPRP